MEMTLGAYYLPLPRQEDPFRMEYILYGAEDRMADATLRVDVTGAKWQVTVSWEGLTAAERATLWAAFGGYVAVPATVVLPDEATFTAMVGLGSWSESQWYDRNGDCRYDISFALKEV